MGAAKTIMVAAGFSQYTQNLLNYAADIAVSMNAELIIASIINARDIEAVGTIAAMGYDVNSENYVAGMKAEREEELDKLLKKLARLPEKTRTVFKTGDPGDELLKLAVKERSHRSGIYLCRICRRKSFPPLSDSDPVLPG